MRCQFYLYVAAKNWRQIHVYGGQSEVYARQHMKQSQEICWGSEGPVVCRNYCHKTRDSHHM